MKKLGKVGRELELLPDARQRADHKGREIAKALRKQRHAMEKFDIEVVDVNPIPQGVEVFARVFNKDGSQVGFGPDGSVDIERFRFINPPILVLDGEDLIEDAEAAQLQSLDQTVAATFRFSDERIVAGKRGSTVTTVYPDADPESTSSDASVARAVASETFATIAGGAGTHVFDTSALLNVAKLSASTTTGEYSQLHRSFFLFDTSSIPDADTVSSAVFSLYCTAKANIFSTTPDIAIVSATPGSNTAPATGDYSNFGTTDYATRVAHSSITTSAYNDFTLNATGIAAVSKTGVTKIGVRFSWDVDSAAPTWASGNEASMTCYFADQTGTTNDPKLVVTHAASGPAASRRSIICV